MKCSKCGTSLTKDDEFCPECGKKIEKHIERAIKRFNFKWVNTIVIVIIIVVALSLLLIIKKPFASIGTQEKGMCNKPYILVGTSCCLDQNGNSICDEDEKNIEEESKETKSEEKLPEFKKDEGIVLFGKQINTNLKGIMLSHILGQISQKDFIRNKEIHFKGKLQEPSFINPTAYFQIWYIDVNTSLKEAQLRYILDQITLEEYNDLERKLT